jgi:TolB-like protein/Tfp pilus assembly protein PilF
MRMQKADLQHRIFSFDDFTLDLTRGRLLGPGGAELKLRPKSFEVLLHLVENSRRLISKDELMAAIWRNTAVTDDSLVQCLIEVRRALGDSVQRMIRTVPRRGYIFEPHVVEQKLRNSSRQAPIRSIAVLPLEDLSANRAQEYFADGMTEALISNLSRIRALRVISRTSIMRYKGANKSLPEIAHELDVDALVEGSVRRSGGRVRVTTKLITAATDAPFWIREYEREVTDILKLESEIARAVANEIGIQVGVGESARLSSARTINAQAYEAYLLGRHHLARGDDQSLRHAMEYFQAATRTAPDYAAAYAAQSEAWMQLGIAEARYNDVESEARAAALKAIEFDELLPEAHIALANIKISYDWDWLGARQEFERALALEPGNVDAHLYYGHVLTFQGRHEEGIAEGESAVQLDPLSASAHSALGWFLHFARRHEEGLARLQRALELEPRNVLARIRLGKVCTQLGQYPEAIAAFENVRSLAPKADDYVKAGTAHVFALMGKKQEALGLIRGLAVDGYVIAVVHAKLGDIDRAFQILENAVQNRGEYLYAMGTDPAFANLHADSRWTALLRRINFYDTPVSPSRQE